MLTLHKMQNLSTGCVNTLGNELGRPLCYTIRRLDYMRLNWANKRGVDSFFDLTLKYQHVAQAKMTSAGTSSAAKSSGPSDP